MSIAASRPVNGHAIKKRKLSHDSTDAASESGSASYDENEILHESNLKELSENVSTAQSRSAQRSPSSRDQNVTTTKTTSTSSSALMLQTQIFLDQVRPDHALHLKKARPTLDRIIDIIKAVPVREPMSYAQAQSFSQKTLRVTIPWSRRPAADIKYSFQYAKPTKITVEGLIVHQLGTCDAPRILVVPEMPDESFQDKDYLNYRCLHKRAFFLACIAATVQKELGKSLDVNFAFLDDNNFLPVIRITEKGDFNIMQRTTFEISPCFPTALGPIGKLTPVHNNIRKHDLIDVDANDDDTSNSTPLYNSTLRWLASTGPFHQLLDNATSRADNFRDASLLGATWLQRRGFSSAINEGGFGPQEWSLMCALLLESGGHQGRPLFSTRYSTLQMFKAMLQVISGRDMHDAFVLRGKMTLGASLTVPVIFDNVTGVNILDKMTPWSYAKLKHYAKSSLAVLNSRTVNGFDATFTIHAADPVLQFDEVYEIEDNLSPERKASIAQRNLTLYEVLKQGLGDRAQLIDITSDSMPTWKVTSSTPHRGSSKITLGILINADTTTRLVDHGPSVDEKTESESFRSFWGEKAELRKFKDGRICESLVWGPENPVTQQIIQFLCLRHLKLDQSSIHASHSVPISQLRSRISADEAFATVSTRFQTLSSTLHHLDGLPLPIRSVSAASEVIRSSSVILPLEPGLAQPIDVVVQFDTSGRWPDNLQAVQYTKIAFLTKIGDLLVKEDRKLDARVGVENTSASSSINSNTSFLDLIYPSTAPSLSPLIFRLRIYHEREVHLLQQTLSDKTLRPAVRESYQSALHHTKQSFLARPAHTTAIRSLVTQFQPLSITIRLLKSWVSAHHLSQHIPSEILEVVAVSVFVLPAPWSAPGTATTGFSRCLQFLSQWDWSTQPLIVDASPSQDMSLEQRNELETRFAAWRQMDPNMNTVTWFVGTNLDATGVVWTQGTATSGAQPPRVVASRLTALAKAAMSLLEGKLRSESSTMTQTDWSNIFTSSLDDFDFVIHLKTSVLRGKKSKAAVFKNLELAASLDADTTGIDDVSSYLEDLTASFGSAAIFFYAGKYSGSRVIGGLWRPHVRGKDAKPWKIRLGYSTIPVKVPKEDENAEPEGMCRVNTESMLAEMGIIGEGLVEKIVTKDT